MSKVIVLIITPVGTRSSTNAKAAAAKKPATSSAPKVSNEYSIFYSYLTIYLNSIVLSCY